MATLEAVAYLRAVASNRLAAAAQQLAAQFEVATLDMPSLNGADPLMVQAKQLEAVAGFLERLLASQEVLLREALLSTRPISDYDTLTDEALWGVVVDRKMKVGSVDRDELIDLLRAYDAQQVVPTDTPEEATGSARENASRPPPKKKA